MTVPPLPDDVRRLFALQQAHRWTVAQSTAKDRVARLDRLRAAILAHKDVLCEAMWRDFRKPPAEAQLTEIHPTLIELGHVRKHLAEWMQPRPAGAPWVLMSTRSEIRYEPRGVVLIMAPWNYPFGLVVTPLELAYTRNVEHEADRFGLELTQTNHSAGAAFVKLQQDALANPRPGLLFKIFRESHPPLGERIDFANEYHPWSNGQPLVYGGKFRQ